MSHTLNVGDLAMVIPGGLPNNVRERPNGPIVPMGSLPQGAVLAILPRPARWRDAYPYNDGVHVWWYVRGRTANLAGSHFQVIEGWTAANEYAVPFLGEVNPSPACLGTGGETHLQPGQEAYVLPSIGLNIRRHPNVHTRKIGGLAQGTIVTVMGAPQCNNSMVWWQVQNMDGWISEGNRSEWLLAPLR